MRTVLACLSILAALALPAAAAEPAPLSYAGKTVLVTGSTDGLGRELALALAADGAHVIVHGRNAERGQAVVDEITAGGKGSARFVAADFSSLQAVRDFAEAIARDTPRLDLLVNNAGVAFNDGTRHASADGHELQFAVNYLAGWVLVNRLRPNLAAAAPSRIINVASLSAEPIDFDDVMLEAPDAARRGYGQSKLAQVSMTVELAPAFAADGITMVSLHPATLMNTTMVEGLGIPPRTTVEAGRDHVMGLVRAPTLVAGAFYVEGTPGEPLDPQPSDAAARQRLVTLSEQLTGVARD
ncbi:MAG TPA: SDR family NAD(P)-dependent oxidoreductase [Arenimonas sp.]|uniref:SDR family NAD(P)-dependent oxidoreductase n=1 Tax=Arenimonas sp. TaxID=1872635 RepID=UPI002D7ECCDC|nr:SDR family NAD(P)-dependent oxidoreductase [Arenimonas sp.]HEU0153650.1 SDR family NAD(P)-dependent oxidoreductase [Arenimonas sp.]